MTSLCSFASPGDPLCSVLGGGLCAQVVPAVASRCDPATASLNLELDGAVVTWLDKATALLGLKTGRLVTACLRRQAGVVRELLVHSVGSGSVCSCASRVSDDLLFLGSWSGDSLLVRYHPVLEGDPAATPALPSSQLHASSTPSGVG